MTTFVPRKSRRSGSPRSLHDGHVTAHGRTAPTAVGAHRPSWALAVSLGRFATPDLDQPANDGGLDRSPAIQDSDIVAPRNELG